MLPNASVREGIKNSARKLPPPADALAEVAHEHDRRAHGQRAAAAEAGERAHRARARARAQPGGWALAAETRSAFEKWMYVGLQGVWGGQAAGAETAAAGGRGGGGEARRRRGGEARRGDASAEDDGPRGARRGRRSA
ncbi:unnamed protein product [Prorocentrum cordatum]|uniref:Selenoprotein O n=1 Tax=Prorocentrum cordatum TaxID=2364126 RepID=A0ABN9QY69_9DINO|nr:unnamed protein product [Polarella glacialis]